MIFKTPELMPRISIKALILSNLAFWGFAVAGVIITTILGLTGAGLVALHNATTASIDHVMSSPMLIGAWLIVGGVLAPLLGGYTAARIAPREKLLNGALSTSLFVVLGAAPRHGRRVSLPVVRDAFRCCGAGVKARVREPRLGKPSAFAKREIKKTGASKPRFSF